MGGLPAAFERDPDDDARAEVAACRGTTLAERARIHEALCTRAAEQIAQHPDPSKALDWQDPLAPETEDALRRLRERYRRGPEASPHF